MTGGWTGRNYLFAPSLTMLGGSPETGTRVRVGNADCATSPERRPCVIGLASYPNCPN